MQVESNRHINEELLETYAMGKLPEEQTAPLEEHLLVCSDCDIRLAEIDDYLVAVKAAAGELENREAVRKPRFLEILSGRFWHIPAPLWAAGLAAAMVVAVAIPFAHQNVRETQVYLSTLRGLETGASAHGKILLKIDVSTVAALPAYQLQLVRSDGSEIWRSRVVPQSNQILAPVPQKLSADRYWVRLYSEADSTHPLQEFALRVD